MLALRKLMRSSLISAGALTLLVGSATAGNVVYTPVNPSFGGNPLNSSHLLSTANAQRNATASDVVLSSSGSSSSSSDQDDADLFVRQLQGRLLSALASQVTEAIFGESPQDNGTITFGSTEIEFSRNADSIELSITDFTDGTVTQIVVPQLVTD